MSWPLATSMESARNWANAGLLALEANFLLQEDFDFVMVKCLSDVGP